MSYELTPRFEKELNSFFNWAISEKYIIYNKSNEIVKWDKTLLIEFNESPRKKLDGYLKNVFNIYIIKLNNQHIQTYIDIITKFKELKELKELKNNKNNQNNQDNQNNQNNQNNKDNKYNQNNQNNKNNQNNNNINLPSENNIIEIQLNQNDLELSKVNNNNNVKKSMIDSYTQTDLEVNEITKEITKEITIDNTLNTKNTWWLGNLDVTSEQLVKTFGAPFESHSICNNKVSKQRYEWKFKYNGNIYSIYDWKFNNNEFPIFEETDWFLSGNNDNDVNNIIKLIDDMIKNKEEFNDNLISVNIN
jgi:hypothetical protein